jgi:23S rRNA (pseudouridine1915-N3)-methyltransferase
LKVKIAWVGKTKDHAIQALTTEYLKRLNFYTDAEGISIADESAVRKFAERSNSRSAHSIVLLDSRGRQLSSEQLAEFIANHQNRNPQPLLFAVGGANGFDEEMRSAASFVLSLGKMTLSHELARIVLLEQLYRAFSILKGHPYHLGH